MEEKLHSRFGGSGAYRWLNCRGSVPLSDKAPVTASSRYAETGTFAHALGEMCLANGDLLAVKHTGKTIKAPGVDSTKVITREIADAVQVYLDTVYKAMDEGDATELAIEEIFTLDIPEADKDEIYGSADACIFNHATGKLTVIDYKNGSGIVVRPDNNAQLKFYALGCMNRHPEWDVLSIELVIVQPNAPVLNPKDEEEAQGVFRWLMSPLDLMDYRADIREAVADAKSTNPTFKAGQWCWFCKAATICKVREGEFIAAAEMKVEAIADLDFMEPQMQGDPQTLVETDVEWLSKTINAFDEYLAPWVEQLRARRDELMYQGVAVPGYKVVEKQSRRVYAVDEEDIAAWAEMFYGIEKEEILPRKLVGITALEKTLKASLPPAEFKQAKDELNFLYVDTPRTGYTVVPDSNNRPAAILPKDYIEAVDLGSLFTEE